MSGPWAGHEGTAASETPTPLHPHTPTLRTGDYLLALASGVLAFMLYLRTLAPGLLGGDSGEFQFAAWLGGLAHPTGYPLYLMLGWLWTHLVPWHDPAWRMNALSALCGGVATGLVYLVALRVLGQCRSLTFQPWWKANCPRDWRTMRAAPSLPRRGEAHYLPRSP